MIRPVKTLLEKYRTTYLKQQVRAVIFVVILLPLLALSGTANSYYFRVLKEQLVWEAEENVGSRAAHLSEYMKNYMEPYFEMIIDERLLHMFRTETFHAPMNSYDVYSILGSYDAPSNNEVALLMCTDTELRGYLYIRKPTGQRIRISGKDWEEWPELAALARESMATDTLVSCLVEYHGEPCIAVAQRIYDYTEKKCSGCGLMVLYAEDIWEVTDTLKYRYIGYEIVAEDGTVLRELEPWFEKSLYVTSKENEIHWTNWNLVSYVDDNAINKKVWSLTLVWMCSSLAVIALAVLLVDRLIGRRMKKLSYLEMAMREAPRDFKLMEEPVDSSADFYSLFKGYNTMVRKLGEQRDQIQKQNDEKIQLLQKKQDAELKALELEINSHFLYNTMNTINYTAIENGDYETSRLLKKFADVLRYMTRRRYQLVTAEEEIAWLEEYLYLQKMRFDDKFDYVIEVSGEARRAKIRKLLLQPFVENAIIHGFEEISGQGELFVQISRTSAGQVEVRICDNGRGMDRATVEKIRDMQSGGPESMDVEKLGLGIANTVFRMQMYYDKRFELEVHSAVNEGTAFVLRFPFEQ